ncbi:NAD(P)-binding domain-containing protein [Flavobacterium ajazii]|uniref:NAD(P)-binding domain-containing protein n=1 Tax=Flavobacterium ajazii TaxID=2692318 RepID=UPI0013D52840|nr:NAD(P)-binding domain-containing protein [Flavobacterium ajazii]
MKIGIIGIGSLTLELARRSALAGYEVMVNNPRGNSLVRDTIAKIGSNIKLGPLCETASADIIIFFVPKDNLESVIRNLPDMSGKIILYTSGLIFNPQSLLSGISNALTYQITASLLPSAHVVKLFHPVRLESKKDDLKEKKDEIFYIANHTGSKHTVRTFLKNLNFSAINLSGRLHPVGVDLNAGITPVVIQPSGFYSN